MNSDCVIGATGVTTFTTVLTNTVTSATKNPFDGLLLCGTYADIGSWTAPTSDSIACFSFGWDKTSEGVPTKTCWFCPSFKASSTAVTIAWSSFDLPVTQSMYVDTFTLYGADGLPTGKWGTRSPGSTGDLNTASS